MENKPHLFITTPMYGGMTTGFFCQSLIPLPGLLKERGIDVSFSFMFNESLVQRARNGLVNVFMKNPNATHLMFIDADIRFNAADILSMMDADKDIICGIYPKKEINWRTVDMAVKQGYPVEALRHFTGSMVVNLVDYQGEVTVPRDQPVEVFAGGTGFMMIKREVFEKLQPLVNSYTNDVSETTGELKADTIYEYFPVFIEKETNRLLSEDYAFCKIARDYGFKIYAAPWVNLGHFGTYLFEGGLLPAP
jgi:hypothetical protein